MSQYTQRHVIRYAQTSSSVRVYLDIIHIVRYYRGKVSKFNQSEAREHCFLASDWLKVETLPRKYRTLLLLNLYAGTAVHRFSVSIVILKLGKLIDSRLFNFQITLFAFLSFN